MLNFEFTRPQSEFFYSKAPSVAAVAGFGSGKTDIALHRAFNTMFQNPKADVLYLAPTYPLIRDIWYPKVEDFLDEQGLNYFINKTEHKIYIQGFGKMLCRTMEKPERIVGFEVLDAFLDELDILPIDKALEVWRKTKARCRQKIKGKKNQMFVTTTPEGFKATYHLFEEKPLKNSHLIQMSTYSNAHNLPEDYIQELLDNYPEALVEAYVLGKFTNLTSGTVYRMFNRKKNNAPGILPKKGEHLHIGMDFNVRNMSAIIHVVRDGNPIACGEILKGDDTPWMIEVIQDRYKKHPITIYPDATGKKNQSTDASKSDIKMLKDSGFYVVADNKNPFVKDRVNSMNIAFRGLNGYKYFVNIIECPRYTRTLEQQVYDKNGVPEKNKDKDKAHDDPNDAGGYFINKMFGITKPTTTQTHLPV